MTLHRHPHPAGQLVELNGREGLEHALMRLSLSGWRLATMSELRKLRLPARRPDEHWIVAECAARNGDAPSQQLLWLLNGTGTASFDRRDWHDLRGYVLVTVPKEG